MELDLRQSAIGFEYSSLLELRVLLQLLNGGFATAFVACCEVDEERAVVEWRLWILECELPDYGEPDAL